MQNNLQNDNPLMQKIEQECLITTTVSMDYPPVALSLGEKLLKSNKGDKLVPIPIGTYGNFSFVQSPPKTKKTFFISLLASVYLSGKNNFAGDIKGHRDGRCLLHFDTEQGKWHAQRVFKRAVDMADMDGSENICYYTYGLRTLGFKTRIEFIEHCI